MKSSCAIDSFKEVFLSCGKSAVQNNRSDGMGSDRQLEGSSPLNKTQLIEEVAKETGLTKGQAAKSVQAVFDAIEGSLKKGDSVNLIGFGAFSVTDRPARTGRNPRTGAEIQIPKSRLPKFKPGKTLKESVTNVDDEEA